MILWLGEELASPSVSSDILIDILSDLNTVVSAWGKLALAVIVSWISLHSRREHSNKVAQVTA